ncbi:MAG: GGDEF domain-containing protein [Elusimicrobia bacterium]|nr:GGDEF domain-containing protein [Elusimicrobiota bacterium]
MTQPMEHRRADGPHGQPYEDLPHTVLYPLAGAVIGMACPAGALVLRLAAEHAPWTLGWVVSEIADNAIFYVYMGISTMVAFAAFGYVVGRRSESQRALSAELRRRVHELHLTSITDGLTGAYSHAYLQEALQLELAAAKRDGRRLSVLMLDLDDFKKLNDTRGHLFGDRVLREVTETISATVRHADIIARYGGEEFVVVMPGADTSTAVRIAERVRRAVSRAPVSDGGAPVHTRLSIGVATFDGHGEETSLSMLGRADANLYSAKRQGKDRTIS